MIVSRNSANNFTVSQQMFPAVQNICDKKLFHLMHSSFRKHFVAQIDSPQVFSDQNISYVPSFYQLVYGYSAVRSGALLLPITLTQSEFFLFRASVS
jgi:hypothetical protein